MSLTRFEPASPECKFKALMLKPAYSVYLLVGQDWQLQTETEHESAYCYVMSISFKTPPHYGSLGSNNKQQKKIAATNCIQVFNICGSEHHAVQQ